MASNRNSSIGGATTSDCEEVKIPEEIFFTITVISLSENLLIVLAVIKNKNLHSPMNCFICSLAFSNLLSTLAKTCENIMISHLDPKGETEKKVDDIIDALLCMSFLGSISNLLAIAVDRYITIFHALRYHHLMTMKRASVILAGIWLFCAVNGMVLVFFSYVTFILIFFILLYVVSLLLILVLYVRMFLLAQAHARTIASLPGQRVYQTTNAKGTITLTILLGVFIVCWSPFFFHLIIMLVCPFNPYCECYRSLFQVNLLFMMLNAVIDPLIYAFRSAELRNTFRNMFCLSRTRLCS